MTETQAQPTPHISALETAIRSCDDAQRELFATKQKLTGAFNHLLMRPASDENLDLLFSIRDKLQELRPAMRIDSQPGDWFEGALKQIDQQVEAFRLGGAFSWRQPAILNVALMPHCRSGNFSDDEAQAIGGNLPVISIDTLSRLDHPLCRVAEYLEREVSSDVLERTDRLAILPLTCRMPSNTASGTVKPEVIEFRRIADLVRRFDGHVRAKRNEAARERRIHNFDPELAGISRQRWESLTAAERDRIIAEHRSQRS